jgi:hypothetical protein
VLLQVSRLQVAELVTAAVINPELAENKCVEVVAETTAPELGLETLWEQAATEISKVCVDIRDALSTHAWEHSTAPTN